MERSTLVLCIHNHQPVGNLPGVFEHAYRAAYLPFLDRLESHPDVKVVLHNTGPLLEWYEEHAPEYIARLRALVERGQVEVLGGGFYEPILPSIPERDALGQIDMMSDYVERAFGVRPRGMWLAERVWEPGLARVVGTAGVEYLATDDYAFRLAGVPEDELVGYFLTDQEGVSVGLFPISKRLRYAIPFEEPESTVSLLRDLARRGPGHLAVLGDDGEKFGVWPGTHAHVYTNGWLERFFRALEENSDWLETATFSDFIERERPRGRVYLPTSSYPEMMEWALPTEARLSYERMKRELEEGGRAAEWGPFVSGGTWRGFAAKYDETNLMIRKMLRVSRKVERARRVLKERGGAEGSTPDDGAEVVSEARRELWRGQCNCAYWHGVFGGLYLPHLRSAIYEHLVRAEGLAEELLDDPPERVAVEDHDLDGLHEVLLETQAANAYVAPERGGTIQELDLKSPPSNLLAVMTRYAEPYHEALSRASTGEGEDGAVSIHNAVRAKEKDLARLAVPDRRPRRSAVDHMLRADCDLEAFREGRHGVLDLAEVAYDSAILRETDAVGVRMVCSEVGPVKGLRLEKRVVLARDGFVDVEHLLRSDEPTEVLFASEWNMAFLTEQTEYVWAEVDGSRRLALGREREVGPCGRIAFHDRLRDLCVVFEREPEGSFWLLPIETASQSEGGFERVFQGVTIVPFWKTALGPTVTRVAVRLRFERNGDRRAG